jgi:SPP1 gp7 family putative phage head morphogenesis protein
MVWMLPHSVRGNAKRKYRLDPTRTYVLRRKYIADMDRRFRELIQQVKNLVYDKDFFKLDDSLFFASAHINQLPRDSNKINQFMEWLRRAQAQGILQVSYGTPVQSAASQSWQNIYIQTTYRRALQQAGAKLRRQGVEVSDRWMDYGFLEPVHADRAGIIYTRAFTQLAGVTEAVSADMSRVLAEGMASGIGSQQLARNLENSVSIGMVRARRIAQTEIINAHAEATLNAYTEAGIEGVEVEAEFSTSRDNVVCPKCEALEGRTFSIEEARGVIPVHPNCRCAWVPLVTDTTGAVLR